VTTFFIDVFDTDGTQIARINDFISLQYNFVELQVGSMILELDDTQLDKSLLGVDKIFQIYREIPGQPPYLEGERLWYLRRWNLSSRTNSSHLIYTLEAQDANHLLTRRIINGHEGGAVATKAQAGDNMLKAYVREAAGSLTTAARDMRPYLDVAANVGAAAVLRFTGEHTNLYDTCKWVCQKGQEKGIYLVFDCVYSAPGNSIFTTYVGARGTDHGSTSGDIRLFGIELGNLSDAALSYDFMETANYCFSMGSGRQDAREIAEVSNAPSIARSILNRHEFVYHCSGIFRTTTEIQAMGYKALGKVKDKVRFTGYLVDTPAMRYGVDYGFGDIVTVQFAGVTVDCHVVSIANSVREGGETPTIYVEGEL
jgi:hypothetical protein